jgi:hypothetical protein
MFAVVELVDGIEQHVIGAILPRIRIRSMHFETQDTQSTYQANKANKQRTNKSINIESIRPRLSSHECLLMHETDVPVM